MKAQESELERRHWKTMSRLHRAVNPAMMRRSCRDHTIETGQFNFLARAARQGVEDEAKKVLGEGGLALVPTLPGFNVQTRAF